METGNLRKASEILGISHSGLSKTMKIFEAELGFKLLLPSGRGIAITDEGMRLFERSKPFFEELERLLGKQETRSRELLRLGSFEVFTSHFTGKLLRDYLENTEIEIHELIPGRLEEALLSHKIDVGITYEPVPRKGVEYLRITSVEMGLYSLQGAFSGLSAVEIPFAAPVSPLEGAPSGVKGLDAWPDDLFKRNILYRVDLMTTALDLVRQGLCAVFIPQFVAHLHNESVRPEYRLTARSLPEEMPPVRRDVFIVKRESTLENAQIRRIAQALRKLCKPA